MSRRTLFLVATVLLSGAGTLGTNADHESPGAADAATTEFRIVVPGLARERPAPLVEHPLKEGLTLADVATLYDMTPDVLFALNGVDDPRDIPAGTKLVVVRPPPPPARLPCGDLLAPVDKEHALPADCEPADLQALPAEYSYGGTQLLIPHVAEELVDMLAAAASEGHALHVRSSHRDYDLQETTFQFWVDQLGYEQAVRVSAEPGHSEHQLGTTADVTNAAVGYELEPAFADTAGGRWLAEHAAGFGFVISYVNGREGETGFSFEPWHIRYVGPKTAAAYEASGLTLNQYLAREWLPGRYRLDLPME